MIARLNRGISSTVAQQELDTIARGLGEKYPEEREHGIRVTGYEHLVVGDSASGLGIFLGAVAMVALSACANIAGLLLIRFIEKDPRSASVLPWERDGCMSSSSRSPKAWCWPCVAGCWVMV